MRIKTCKAPVYDGLVRFSTTLLKLHPISVGGSVDKVFAYRYRPRSIGLTSLWLKIDQVDVKTLGLNKSRIFFN